MRGREMKRQDPARTDGGESGALGRVWGSRTKAGGSKVIRDRCSSSSKRCRQRAARAARGGNLSVRALGIVCSQG